MRQPDIYTASRRCLDSILSTTTEISDGSWVPARPIAHNAFSWKWRWKLAWRVLTGTADILQWETD